MSRLGITYGRPNVLTIMRTNLLSVTASGEWRRKGRENRGSVTLVTLKDLENLFDASRTS